MIRIGAVVQRYGDGVVGGAETLARDVCERLNASGCDVTVFTTTATDYITWANEFAPGESVLRGVRILRFPVDRQRDIAAFNRFSELFFQSPARERDELLWIFEQGPQSPQLLKALESEYRHYDAFLFFTYLYLPTVLGMEKIDRPIALFPTAHDEPPLYLEIMRPVFSRPERLFFLTGAEQELVKRVFGPRPGMELVRTGLDIPAGVDGESFRRRHLIFGAYMLYAGRIERGKGLEEIFEVYPSLRKFLRYILRCGIATWWIWFFWGASSWRSPIWKGSVMPVSFPSPKNCPLFGARLFHCNHQHWKVFPSPHWSLSDKGHPCWPISAVRR